MTLVEMIALVVAIVQLIKEWVLKLFKVEIKGFFAVVLTFIVSVGVVGYKYLNEGIPFELFAFIALVIQVFFGASAGYATVKIARSKIR